MTGSEGVVGGLHQRETGDAASPPLFFTDHQAVSMETPARVQVEVEHWRWGGETRREGTAEKKEGGGGRSRREGRGNTKAQVHSKMTKGFFICDSRSLGGDKGKALQIYSQREENTKQ